MRNVKLLAAMTAALVMVFAASCGDDDSGDVEICTDGFDNDGDGLVDCGDGDCANSAACNHCGNGSCEPQLGETAANCPADCSAGYCGDGTCDAGENSTSCPADCSGSYCGDGTCDANEDATSCPADCSGSYCGDGTCDANEDATSCPADCSSSTCDAGGTCDACINTQCTQQTVCTAEFVQCFQTNTVCADFNTCITNCGSDSACQQQCQTDYAAGVNDYMAVLECAVCEACPSDCAADVPTVCQ